MKNSCVLPLPEITSHGVMGMPTLEINFCERDTLPDRLERIAKELDITVEQLAKRFICAGVEDCEPDSGPSEPGESLEDFLVKNGVLKEK